MWGGRGRQDPAPDGDTDVRRNSAGAIASEVRGGLSALLACFCKAGRSRRGSPGVCEGSAGVQMERSRSFLPPPAFPGGHRGWGCSPHRVRQGEEQRRGEREEIGALCFPTDKMLPPPERGAPLMFPFWANHSPHFPSNPPFYWLFYPLFLIEFLFSFISFFIFFLIFFLVFFFSVCCC